MSDGVAAARLRLLLGDACGPDLPRTDAPGEASTLPGSGGFAGMAGAAAGKALYPLCGNNGW